MSLIFKILNNNIKNGVLNTGIFRLRSINKLEKNFRLFFTTSNNEFPSETTIDKDKSEQEQIDKDKSEQEPIAIIDKNQKIQEAKEKEDERRNEDARIKAIEDKKIKEAEDKRRKKEKAKELQTIKEDKRRKKEKEKELQTIKEEQKKAVKKRQLLKKSLVFNNSLSLNDFCNKVIFMDTKEYYDDFKKRNNTVSLFQNDNASLNLSTYFIWLDSLLKNSSSFNFISIQDETVESVLKFMQSSSFINDLKKKISDHHTFIVNESNFKTTKEIDIFLVKLKNNLQVLEKLLPLLIERNVKLQQENCYDNVILQNLSLDKTDFYSLLRLFLLQMDYYCYLFYIKKNSTNNNDNNLSVKEKINFNSIINTQLEVQPFGNLTNVIDHLFDFNKDNFPVSLISFRKNNPLLMSLIEDYQQFLLNNDNILEVGNFNENYNEISVSSFVYSEFLKDILLKHFYQQYSCLNNDSVFQNFITNCKQEIQDDYNNKVLPFIQKISSFIDNNITEEEEIKKLDGVFTVSIVNEMFNTFKNIQLKFFYHENHKLFLQLGLQDSLENFLPSIFFKYFSNMTISNGGKVLEIRKDETRFLSSDLRSMLVLLFDSLKLKMQQGNNNRFAKREDVVFFDKFLKKFNFFNEIEDIKVVFEHLNNYYIEYDSFMVNSNQFSKIINIKDSIKNFDDELFQLVSDQNTKIDNDFIIDVLSNKKNEFLFNYLSNYDLTSIIDSQTFFQFCKSLMVKLDEKLNINKYLNRYFFKKEDLLTFENFIKTLNTSVITSDTPVLAVFMIIKYNYYFQEIEYFLKNLTVAEELKNSLRGNEKITTFVLENSVSRFSFSKDKIVNTFMRPHKSNFSILGSFDHIRFLPWIIIKKKSINKKSKKLHKQKFYKYPKNIQSSFKINSFYLINNFYFFYFFIFSIIIMSFIDLIYEIIEVRTRWARISQLTTKLKNLKLKDEQNNDNLNEKENIFNKKEISKLDNKIQYLKLQQELLKYFYFFSLFKNTKTT